MPNGELLNHITHTIDKYNHINSDLLKVNGYR